jgi:hypothetical protein
MTMRTPNWKPWILAALFAVSGCTDKGGDAKSGDAKSTDAKSGDAKSTADAKSGDASKADLPDAEGILAKAVEAVGGKEKLASITSFHLTGKLNVSGQNINGELELWWKDGDFYTEQKMIGIGEIRAGKQGKRIWSEDPINGRRELSGLEAEQHTWA